MKVVVIGAGKAGYEIALRLSEENHDVVVIDKNTESLQEIANLDVMTIEGNGASPEVLDTAEVGTAQVVVAVTESDEVNMIACMTAKQYGVPTCVARLRNPEYTSANPRGLSLQRLGIDVIIDPEQLAALEISRLLKTPLASDIDYFADGRVTMIGLRVDADAKIVGRSLSQCNLPNSLIAAVECNEEFIIPRGDYVVKAHDHLFVVGRTGNFQQIRALVGKPAHQIRTVAIVGAGRTALNVVKLLTPRRNNISITLFEKDPEQADRAARLFPQILVVQGDATRFDVLCDAGSYQFDALVAVSGEDHVNLLATMLAKELGIREVVAKISREDYAPLATRAGADAVVIPRLLMVSSVLRIVRESGIISIALLKGGAETLEFIAPAGCPLIGIPLKDAHFPNKALLGAIIHGNEVIIPRGDSVIHQGDRAIVFALPDAIDELTWLFKEK